MTQPRYADRRTVLKTITAAAVGGGVASGTAAGSRGTPPGRARGRRNVIEFTASHDHDAGEHFFDLDRSEVASGWTTLEFDNQSEHTHFSYLAKLPEQALKDAREMGYSPLEFYVGTVTKPFQYLMDKVYLTKEQKEANTADLEFVQRVYPDPGERFFGLFAPWFPQVTFHGGVGLTGSGESASTTVDLDSGTYTMECYVKDDENDFHSYRGMIEQIDVTDGDSGAPEPESTLGVSVSTPESGGIELGDGLRPGRHTIGVEFENQPARGYSNLVGHDVHLIRLDGGTTTTEVNEWMNWTDPTQLIAEGDEPKTFLGGVQDITTGLPQTAYFDVRLEPGDYAFVAEVPDPESKGLLTEFSVPTQRP